MWLKLYILVHLNFVYLSLHAGVTCSGIWSVTHVLLFHVAYGNIARCVSRLKNVQQPGS